MAKKLARVPSRMSLLSEFEFVENFRPDLAQRLAERCRMTRAEQDGVGVVVDCHLFGTPAHRHGEAGSQHQIDAQGEGVGPTFAWPERRRRPIEIVNARPHVAGAQSCHHFQLDRLDTPRTHDLIPPARGKRWLGAESSMNGWLARVTTLG